MTGKNAWRDVINTIPEATFACPLLKSIARINSFSISLDENLSAPDSFGGDFESSLDLDWDHEPGK